MKGWLIPLYFLLFSLFFTSCSSALPLPSCPHDQSAALTQFNNSFSVDSLCQSAKTISWKKGTNCCLWDGVKCDNEAGNVITLDLSFSCLIGPLHSNSTLFLLRHLRQLNLAGNHFNMSPIASQFGKLTSLTHLNISESGFEGKIPLAISYLSKLLSLDLSDNHGLIFEGHVFENIMKNLTQLRHLHLSNIDMSSVAPTSFINMSSYITTLILGDNGLQGKFPEDVFHFPYLQKFELFEIDNQLELKFPKTNWSGPLKSLQVSSPYLQQLPDSVGNLRSLEILDLGGGNLKGPIPASLGNLTQLEHLDLSHNNFDGPIPCSVFNFTQLQFLDLSKNKLVGSFPSKVSGLSQLSILRLHHNFLSGRVPSWFFTLPSLVELMLNSNKLNGNFELTKQSELSKLEVLSRSNNALSSFTSASNSNYSLPCLVSLELSSCNISEFPNFVRNLEGLYSLNLSYNRIHVIEADMFLKFKGLEVLDLSHNIPLSVGNNSEGQITEQENNWGSNLLTLDLSNNLLTALEYYPWKSIEVLELGSNLLEGPLLAPPPSTMVFLISNNRLNGEIPSSICNPESSNFIVFLDLSYNNLSGAISKCLGLRHLSILDLQMNKFYGNIPDFCVERNHKLQILNLNNNDFDGSLPKSLANCLGLEVLSLANNKINDTFPHWLGDLPRLQVLVLRSNYFHGQIAHSANESHFSTLQILCLSHNRFSGFLPTTYFRNLKAIDMSNNRFEGTIPEAVGNLISLEVLNLSHNHLTGHIPSSLGNLAALESLDLSCNKLVGEIPSELTDLNFLEVLNLSENQLVGPIPQGKQFNTFLNYSYVGNTDLCGFPVSKSCGRSDPPSAIFEEEEFDSAFGLDWKFVMMGCGCGLVFGFSAGYIMMTIRKPKWLAWMIQQAGNRVLRRFKKNR
ncbi:hypothetical protein ES332_D01G055300v1 [Gossypium tomentosum]|uniref:Leucine-rich repeat-containing N-terminal plant-type domain-containing protein n=1 Tax=Gossypium tomentosum TaxID=34277 RepID=A0A5D2M5P1_GOSTO|nr:hypothetical protein ES332_D01G055300v1 [Gossypium tomentosum]